MKYIVGIDEVGLGALAGPLVVCAVAAPGYWGNRGNGLGLVDSKAFHDEAEREVVADRLAERKNKEFYSYMVVVSSKKIDELGVGVAHRGAIVTAAKRIVEIATANVHGVLPYTDDHSIIVDGNLEFREIPKASSFVKADTKFPTVQAASIIAKVFRDRLMSKLPGGDIYGFEQHKGYPTKAHKNALLIYGPSEHHRFSYKPVKEAALERTAE